MGKRSDFKRRPMDSYNTIDPRAVERLRPFLTGIRTFAEPCCGEMHLVEGLQSLGLRCVLASDIKTGVNALQLTDFKGADCIISNPPWSRPILQDMILHFQQHVPCVWLLFDSDWANTQQAVPFLPQCSHIAAIGRLKWIENSPWFGKDNCSWYRFDRRHTEGPRFYGCLPRTGFATARFMAVQGTLFNEVTKFKVQA